MDTATPNAAAALDELYWRSEILQAIFWMLGEGLAEEADAAELARFLVADVRVMSEQLERLFTGGYLQRSASGKFRLTELGRVEGARDFQDEFADFARPGHYECAPDCWCHDAAHAGERCPTHPNGKPEPDGD